MNPLRRLLFGSGRIPDEHRAALARESLLLLDEGLHGSITRRNYRAPGKRMTYEREWMSFAIAITNRRVVVWSRRGKRMDVPHHHPTRRSVTATLEAPDRLCLAYDAGAFSTARSGRVELRMRTPRAAEIVAMMTI